MSYLPRQKHTPEQWRQLLEAQAVSGQSQAAFCAEHGLSKSSFQFWKRRLKTTLAGQDAPAWSSALFAPLTGASSASLAEAKPADDWTIELDLGGGVFLRLRRYRP